MNTEQIRTLSVGDVVTVRRTAYSAPCICRVIHTEPACSGSQSITVLPTMKPSCSQGVWRGQPVSVLPHQVTTIVASGPQAGRYLNADRP